MFLAISTQFFFTHLYCLVGCLRMIVWTHALPSVNKGNESNGDVDHSDVDNSTDGSGAGEYCSGW